MKDLMVDIEALGTGRNGLVTQIGACYFDRYTGEIGNKFSVNFSLKDSFKHGFEVTPDALLFWLERNPTWIKNVVEVNKGAQMFRDFSKNAKVAWAHATFDFVLITNMYRKLGQGMPISYRNMRDIRTLVDLAGLPYKKPQPKKGEPRKTHDGLDDCIYQVKYCVECFNALRGAKDEDN